MNKTEILSTLKSILNLKRIGLPAHMDFSINDAVLKIGMPKYTDGKEKEQYGALINMQKDSATFEGWMFAIMINLPSAIESVELTWERPLSLDKNAQLHYNSFLLRVKWCLENYTWFHVGEDVKKELNGFMNDLGSLVMNRPNKPCKEDAQNYEHQLEREIFKILGDKAGHQLPVGLFKDVVSDKNALTPGGGSQIDLWKTEGDAFKVFELKIPSNKPVGIVSELMFYANIFHRLMVTGQIKYEDDAFTEAVNYRGFDIIRDAIIKKQVKFINAVFLAENLHTLFNSEAARERLLDKLNENKAGIIFSYEKVSEYISI